MKKSTKILILLGVILVVIGTVVFVYVRSNTPQQKVLYTIPTDVVADLIESPDRRLSYQADGTWGIDIQPGYKVIQESRIELSKITERDPYVTISKNEHDVVICGNNYTVPTVTINGYDFFKRLSAILKTSKAADLCYEVKQNPAGKLDVQITRAVVGGYEEEKFKPLQLIDGFYRIEIGENPVSLTVDARENAILLSNGFDGEAGPIGYLDR